MGSAVTAQGLGQPRLAHDKSPKDQVPANGSRAKKEADGLLYSYPAETSDDARLNGLFAKKISDVRRICHASGIPEVALKRKRNRQNSCDNLLYLFSILEKS